MTIIETNNLTKEYTARFGKQKVQALNNFSFKIDSGEIFGLLGPNGAGNHASENLAWNNFSYYGNRISLWNECIRQ